VFRLLLLGILLIAGPYARAQQTPFGLPQLMQSLAKVKSASATFTERKTLAILTTELIATGTLTYTAPDAMRKTTITPVPEQFSLAGTQITLTGADGKTHVFSITQQSRIGGLAEGILATLAGDLPTLTGLYTVQFSGQQAAWQLVLVPRAASLAQFVRWIRITGSFSRLTEIDTQNANGDHSEMTVAEDAN